MAQEPPRSTTPLPSPDQPKKSGINTKIVIPVLILVLIAGGFAYSYLQTRNNLETAAKISLETSSLDYEVTNLSLLPPSFDIILLINLNNPSGYDIDYEIELGLFSGETLIAPTSGSLHLDAGGMGVLELSPIHISSDFDILTDSSAQPRMQATITLTTKVWGLVPVSYSETDSNITFN